MLPLPPSSYTPRPPAHSPSSLILTCSCPLLCPQLKLRVRALEAERALSRVEAWQRLIACALAASMLVNVGTVLSVSALQVGATASFLGAGGNGEWKGL